MLIGSSNSFRPNYLSVILAQILADLPDVESHLQHCQVFFRIGLKPFDFSYTISKSCLKNLLMSEVR